MKTYILNSVAEETLAYARKWLDVAMWEKEDSWPADAEALIVRTHPVTRDMMDVMPKLKIICRHGVGLDAIDINYALGKGIRVVNTPTANTNSVVEHIMGLILDCAHKITASYLKELEGLQEKMPLSLSGLEISGKRLGLIGTGHIGTLVGKRLKAGFDMEILAWSPHITEEYCQKNGFMRAQSLDILYRTCDVISLSVPLTKETMNMIGWPELTIMQPQTILINTSRGGIVDENALYKALKEKRIFGAGFDAFSIEPLPANHPLFQCSNFIATPHNAANTRDALLAMGKQSVDEIVRMMHGEDAMHPVCAR